MKSISELLHEHSFFSGLDEPTLELISGCATNVHFRPDHPILRANDAADVFYVIRKGRVAVEVDTPRSGPIVVETLGSGEILGVSWLLPPHRWTFDARAIDDTSAISIDAACLRGKCDDDPALGYALFTRFAGLIHNRLQAARLQILDVYGSNVS